MRKTNIVLISILSLLVIGCTTMPASTSSVEEVKITEKSAPAPDPTTENSIIPTPDPKQAEEDALDDPGDIDQEEPASSNDTITPEQINALSSAREYLGVKAFSRDGLVDQLLYAKYPEDVAMYAADNCGADWNEQALISAKDFLEVKAFSYSGLIDQLVYAKFTEEQATYGVDNCGADWNQQAEKAAKEYLDVMSFSRSGLVDQLVYAGFTTDQAEYGVSQAGL